MESKMQNEMETGVIGLVGASILGLIIAYIYIHIPIR